MEKIVSFLPLNMFTVLWYSGWPFTGEKVIIFNMPTDKILELLDFENNFKVLISHRQESTETEP